MYVAPAGHRGGRELTYDWAMEEHGSLAPLPVRRAPAAGACSRGGTGCFRASNAGGRGYFSSYLEDKIRHAKR
jgi:hypothetical protein